MKSTCPTCKGSGVTVTMQNIGFGVIQQQQVCGTCDGSGEKIEPKNACTSCNGRKVKRKKERLTIEVPKVVFCLCLIVRVHQLVLTKYLEERLTMHLVLLLVM